MQVLENILNLLPEPSDKRIAVHVSNAAERALKQGHPWIFDEAIKKISNPKAAAGDIAIIFDKKNEFLAAGFYDPLSPIRIRVFQHHKPTAVGLDFFRKRITEAYELRRAIFADGKTTAFRLINGENDLLPGMITDLYDKTAVIKIYTPAWLAHFKNYVQALKDVINLERIVIRLNRDLSGQAEKLYGLHDGFVSDSSDGVVKFLENGLTFIADTVHGHKTGFFLDQRENRKKTGELASGRNVLNVFSYTGGFSLYAARGGAPKVVSLDCSKPALDESEKIFKLNKDCPAIANCVHETVCGDAFPILGRYKTSNTKFGLVVVDPPSFAKRQSEVPGALKAYYRLAIASLNVVEKNGILVMASCSSRVPADDFFKIIFSAASASGFELVEMDRTFNAPDHPVRFPEGAYLKCLYAQVKKN